MLLLSVYFNMSGRHLKAKQPDRARSRSPQRAQNPASTPSLPSYKELKRIGSLPKHKLTERIRKYRPIADKSADLGERLDAFYGDLNIRDLLEMLITAYRVA